MTRTPHLADAVRITAWLVAAVTAAATPAGGCSYTVDLSRRDAAFPSPATECICVTSTAAESDTGADTADTGPAHTVPCPC